MCHPTKGLELHLKQYYNQLPSDHSSLKFTCENLVSNHLSYNKVSHSALNSFFRMLLHYDIIGHYQLVQLVKFRTLQLFAALEVAVHLEYLGVMVGSQADWYSVFIYF